jgi:hypothetical protein
MRRNVQELRSNVNAAPPLGELGMMTLRTALCLTAAACSSNASDAAIADAGAAETADAPMPTGSGSATISGTVSGSAFTTASTAFAITGSDDPQNLVVYVFSKNVACADIQSAGWDGPSRLGKDAALQFLELKMKTATVQTFTVVGGPNFGPGEAIVNETLISRTPQPELVASGGSVTVSSYSSNVSAKGTFDIRFGATDSLKGTFDAVYCPGGSEP